MTTTTNNISKYEHLQLFGGMLLQNGFDLLVPNDEYWKTYFHFYKDGHIGYVQSDKYGKFDFSTVHKPCRECGTGFGMDRDVYEPTIKNALNTFVFAPAWASDNDRKAIKKYTSLEEYKNKQFSDSTLITH